MNRLTSKALLAAIFGTIPIKILFPFLVALISIIFGFKFLNLKFSNSRVDSDKKVIFITGCDSGIGLETAKRFHRLGFIILAGCLDEHSNGASELNLLNNSDLAKSHKSIHIVQIDITNVDSIQKAVSYLDDLLAKDDQLRFHCLINNAGVCVVGEFDWFTHDHMEKIINVNLLGTLKVIKSFLSLLIKYKGRIVTIGSVNGLYAYPGISVYCATKSALNLFSSSLRFELSKFGVKVCILNPGDYANKTNIMSNQSTYFEQMISRFSEEQKNRYKGYIEKYIELTNQNIGVTGSKDADKVLFKDLTSLVTLNSPPYEILSVPLINRIILGIYFSLPLKAQVYIFNKVWNRILKLK